jgi:hypothetical protein
VCLRHCELLTLKNDGNIPSAELRATGLSNRQRGGERFVMRRPMLILPAVVVIFLLHAGCSMIGYSIGAMSDAEKPGRLTVAGTELDSIPPGTRISVWLHDNSGVDGRYSGKELCAGDDYAMRYTAYLQKNPESFDIPSLGDSVKVTLISGYEFECEFAGFDYSHVVVKRDTLIIPIALGNLTILVDGRGRTIDSDIAKEIISRDHTPLMTKIVVAHKGGPTTVPVDKIHQIRMHIKKQGKRIGLTIGAIVDALVLMFLASQVGGVSIGN